MLYLIYVSIGFGLGYAPGADGYLLYADFASASGLNTGDPVEIAGVQVGKVESISLTDYQARVGLRIRDTVPLHMDAVATIEPEGLIGDRVVVIEPGNSEQPLGPGDEIEQTKSLPSLQELVGKLLAGDLL